VKKNGDVRHRTSSGIFDFHNEDHGKVQPNGNATRAQILWPQIAGHSDRTNVIAAVILRSHNREIAKHCVEFDRPFDEDAIDRAVFDVSDLEFGFGKQASALREPNAP
jgi:hypothetical protein